MDPRNNLLLHSVPRHVVESIWCVWQFPGGTSGVALNLNFPKMYVWAETLVFAREERRRFRVMFDFSMNISHSDRGKFGSTLTRLSLKWLLYVCIVRSAMVLRCVYGGTNWYEVCCWRKAWMICLEISLSITYVHVDAPAWENILCSFYHAFLIEVDVLFCMGSAKIQFTS